MKIVAVLLILAAGVGGYLFGIQQTAPGAPTVGSSALLQRTEAFEPDCAMLTGALNQPVLLRQADDYLTALSDGKRITVWGLNVENGPDSAWWSAELEPALQQACGND